MTLVVASAGCATLGWYGQAAFGQLELLAKREDIEKRIRAADTPEHERRKLELVLAAREFASSALALPDNDSYTGYVALDRDAVVYNVIAAPEFGLEPKTWCYPMVGCLAYRGYFRRAAAERLAERLAEQGFDVRVAPVAAYSTLGRFDDPVTSPMLAWDDHRLIGLIFHELAHQRLFVKGDTAFNEAFASSVERAGVQRWIEASGSPDMERRRAAYLQRQRAFVELLMQARADLQGLYARELSDEPMRRAKRDRLDRLEADVHSLQGLETEVVSATAPEPEFAPMVPRGFNNADLALLATYELGTHAFGALLAEYDGDFARFYRAVEALAEQGPAVREAFLNSCRTRICT